MNVLKTFLAFTPSFQPCNAYNILVFLLDLSLKNLQLIQDYVGLKMVMQIVVEYDHEVLMPLLVIFYNSLTPTPLLLNLWMLVYQNWVSLELYF